MLVAPKLAKAQSLPDLIERLNSKDAGQVIQQLSDLQSHPNHDPEVVRKVIQLLDDERSIQTNGFFSESVQYSSFFVVSKLGTDDIPVIVQAIELLQTTQAKSYLLRAIQVSQNPGDLLWSDSQEESYSDDAIEGIIVLGTSARSLLARLRLYANSSDRQKRLGSFRLANAFYSISPDTAIGDVLPLVEMSHDFICSSAIEALSKHNVRGERVIAAYIAVLERDDSLSDSREAAIIALRKIGPDAFSAIQAVRKLLELEGLSDYDRKLIQETVNAIQVK